MKPFFQNIILEREKRNAGKNYVIEGVKVINEARFRSSDEVVSVVKRHPEEASGNEDAKRQRCDKVVVCTPENKELQSQKEMRVNNMKDGSILPNGSVIQRPRTPNFISSDDENENSEFLDYDDDENFDDVFSSVPSNAQKWILPSGKCVKEIFSENISQCVEALKGKKKLTAIEKATLKYGMSKIIDLSAHMSEWFSMEDRQYMMKDHEKILKVPELDQEVNEFITEIEKIVLQENNADKAYKVCIEKHINSSADTCLYKITKIYSDFLFEVKDGGDLLEGDENHTEMDLILKVCFYIIKGLKKDFGLHYKWGESLCQSSQSAEYKRGRKCDVRFLSSSKKDLGEWEFSARFIPHKTIGDRCRSSRINQSILNSMLRLELTDEQVKKISVPFLQISGVYGQMLLEDLVNGFYIVLPGEIFELPTKLTCIKTLRQAVKIFKYIIEMYKEVNNTLDQLNYVHNPFNDLFKADGVKQSSHYALKFVHDPWWTPKKNISSRMLTTFEEMENKEE